MRDWRASFCAAAAVVLGAVVVAGSDDGVVVDGAGAVTGVDVLVAGSLAVEEPDDEHALAMSSRLAVAARRAARVAWGRSQRLGLVGSMSGSWFMVVVSLLGGKGVKWVSDVV